MSAAPYYPDEMTCAACGQPIGYADRPLAVIWPDPAGVWCVAHRSCLKRLGETDLELIQ